MQDGNIKYIQFNNNYNPIELIYVAVHDSGDLDGFDKRYGLSNHSSKYFCDICHSTDKYGFTEQNTTYRTLDSIRNNADKYWEADHDRVSLNQRKLDYSKGVKQRPADPIQRQRISLLHLDIRLYGLITIHWYVKCLKARGVTKQRLQVVSDEMRTIGFNLKN